MSLRQFMSMRPLTRTLTGIKNGIQHGWSETARALGLQEDLYFNPLHKPLAQPVTVVIIGAGHRGSIYADFAAKNPAEMKVVAVADPSEFRCHRLMRRHQIPPERCTDGCKVEGECAYSALQIYQRDRKRLYVFDLPEDKSDWDRLILQGLKTNDHGRCVYRMDNNQPDHLTVNILFANGVTAAFSMEAFVSYEGRRTRIMGSQGDITGDMESFTLTTFRTGERSSWALKTDAHGGGDHPMVRDWAQAVGQRNPALLSASIDESVESHLMAFAAERSRLQRTIEDVRL